MPKFKDITFRSGLNVILADKAPGSTDKQTRNGAGKSSVVEVVHFLLGSNADKDSIFRNAALIDAVFSIEFDLANRPTSCERTGAQPSKVRVTAPTFDEWPVQPTIDKRTHEPTLSNTNWRATLGHFIFGLPVGDQDVDDAKAGPTFRALISYFARRQHGGGLVEPEKNAEQQQLGEQQVALSYLLGLDWTLPQRLEEIRAREKSLKELRRLAADGALGALVGKSSELRTELTLAEEASRKLHQNLAKFTIVPEYEALETEASLLTQRISDLSDSNTADRLLVAELKRSIDTERAPEAQDVARLYEEAGVVFPELVHRRFDDVRAFHESVVRNRRSYLDSELRSAENRINVRDQEMHSLDLRRSQIMSILKSGKALEQYANLQSELARREGTVAMLRGRYAAAQQLESEKTELDIERNQLLVRLRRDYEEQRETLDRAILAFEEVSEALYEKAGRLQIEPTLNGPQFSVAIEGARSKGISNMQIFCFDMMLMQVCVARKIGPGFLVHDSHIFDGVDSRQVAKALQVGADLSARNGFQYIITMNSDMAPDDHVAGFDISDFVLARRLLDDGADGGLFGVRFD